MFVTSGGNNHCEVLLGYLQAWSKPRHYHIHWLGQQQVVTPWILQNLLILKLEGTLLYTFTKICE